MPGFDASSWHTIAIHSGVPRDIIESCCAIREGMAEPAVAEDARRDGAIPVVSPPVDELVALSTARRCAGAR